MQSFSELMLKYVVEIAVIILTIIMTCILTIIMTCNREALAHLLERVRVVKAKIGPFEVETVPEFSISDNKSDNNRIKSSSGLPLLLLVYKDLEYGRVEELLDWFEQFRGVDLLDTEIALIRAYIARVCGVPRAYEYLQMFREGHREFYYISMYELSLLRFAKGQDVSEDVEKMVGKMESISPSIQRLWKSLLAMLMIKAHDYSSARKLFRSISGREEDSYEAYASLQLGIVAGALGEPNLMEHYLDLARQINRSRVYPSNEYPYVALVAKHYRAFVNSIIGVNHDLKKDDIQLLKGVSHTVARYAHILRLTEPAIDTLIKISSGWTRSLEREIICERLLNFERYNLQYGGTLVIPMEAGSPIGRAPRLKRGG